MLEPPGTMRTPSAAVNARAIGGLVKERLLHGSMDMSAIAPMRKADENSLLDPRVCPPTGFCGGVWFGCADFPAIQPGLEIAEKPEVFFFVASRGFVKQTLNLRRQHEPSAQVRVIRERADACPISSFGGTSGKRHTGLSKPISANAAFTGIGFDSTKLISMSDESGGGSRAHPENRPPTRAA